MRFVEALGSSTLVQHSRPLFDDDGGHEDHDHVPNHHSLAGQGLAHQLALRSGTGAVFDPRIRQPLDGCRLQGSATPLLFWPVHCYFRDVVIMRRRRMVARVARRRDQLVGTHSSGFHFPLLAAAAHRLRQAQMDSGGFVVVFGFLAALQHGTTIFLICEFLRFVHNESFTGLD